jgi:hypothetical protein
MFLLHTLLAGGWLWSRLWTVYDSRVALGQGGAVVLATGWACVAALLARAASRGSPAQRPWREALLWGVLCVFAAGVGFQLADVGDDFAVAPWIAGLMFGAPALLIAWALERWVRPRLRPAVREPRPVAPAAVAGALVPLLLPAVTIFALAQTTLAPEWHARIQAAGTAGALYTALVPLVLPAALVAAWAHDRAWFGARGAWHDAVGALALGVLLTASALWSGLPAALDGDAAAPAPLRGLVAALRLTDEHTVLTGMWGNSPFRVHDATGLAPDGQPLAGLAGGAAALALACAVLSAALLWRVGRGRAARAGVVWALVPVALLVVPTAVAWWGPAGAPWSVAALATAALLPALWPGARERAA